MAGQQNSLRAKCWAGKQTSFRRTADDKEDASLWPREGLMEHCSSKAYLVHENIVRTAQEHIPEVRSPGNSAG